jgi:hypothetical protein
MRLKVDVSDVPEEFRDAKFEEALLQFKCHLRADTTSPRWLFRLALHEGAHLRYQRKMGGEVKLQGPHMEYKDGQFRTFNGGVEFHPNGSIYDFEHQMACLKYWLAGPLAVTTFTGETEDAEGDTQRACEYLKAPRDEADSCILLARIELWDDLQDPVIVGEILDAARNYATAIFHDDACIDWGLNEYRLDAPGERFPVGLSHLGYAGLLIVDRKEARLFVTHPRYDAEYLPTDTIGGNPLVLLSRIQDKRAENVVRRWNEQVP